MCIYIYYRRFDTKKRTWEEAKKKYYNVKSRSNLKKYFITWHRHVKFTFDEINF